MLSTELKNTAEEWLQENENSIEFFDKFLPVDYIPEDAEDPQEWAQIHGDEHDGTVAFLLRSIESGTGETGVALVLRKGHSWEGVRTWVEGVFISEEDALVKVEEMGFRVWSG
ncbi:hypothetical protein N9E25_07585 [Verrucomicrobiales bacterium]|nr:hypothetical protein [Verrucomicrobiales bacterium]